MHDSSQLYYSRCNSLLIAMVTVGRYMYCEVGGRKLFWISTYLPNFSVTLKVSGT